MDNMPENDSVLSIRRGDVATVQFNRSDRMNSLNLQTKESLLAALDSVASDHTVRCVVLTGTGRAFCVGQDLSEHAGRLERGEMDVWRTVDEHYARIARTIATMPKPVVAAVNGVAAGAGVSFALAADVTVAARSASFNLAFASIGLSADSGTTWWLPRLVGPAKAKELLMFPRKIAASDALALGLVTQVVDDDAFQEHVTKVAAELASGPTMAYAAIRRAIAYSSAHDLTSSLAYEAELMAATGRTEDHVNAVRAFLSKRPPVYLGE
jgi:2-(1,2-epoxy-1,2-dihydrophenyl)acetyl-CoA isomerase